jgi:hypothetical protein
MHFQTAENTLKGYNVHFSKIEISYNTHYILNNHHIPSYQVRLKDLIGFYMHSNVKSKEKIIFSFILIKFQSL